MPLTPTETMARSLAYLAHMLSTLQPELPEHTGASLLEVTYDLQEALLQTGVLRGSDLTAAAAWLQDMRAQMRASLDTTEDAHA